jgi:hypothetical protein
MIVVVVVVSNEDDYLSRMIDGDTAVVVVVDCFLQKMSGYLILVLIWLIVDVC